MLHHRKSAKDVTVGELYEDDNGDLWKVAAVAVRPAKGIVTMTLRRPDGVEAPLPFQLNEIVSTHS